MAADFMDRIPEKGEFINFFRNKKLLSISIWGNFHNITETSPCAIVQLVISVNGYYIII